MERRDASPLGSLVHEFEQLGDTFQALRAQRLYVPLCRPGPGTASSALLRLARLEREEGRFGAAIRTLASLRDTLAEPDGGAGDSGSGSGSGSGSDKSSARQRTNLGAYIVEEHYAVARTAATDTALADEVRAPPWPPGSSWRDSPDGQGERGAAPRRDRRHPYGHPRDDRHPYGQPYRHPHGHRCEPRCRGQCGALTPPQPSAG